jgi:hypothetical protein
MALNTLKKEMNSKLALKRKRRDEQNYFKGIAGTWKEKEKTLEHLMKRIRNRLSDRHEK